MVILDTNVLSEVLKASPAERVVAWLKDQPRPSLFTTTVTRGEILYGIRLLPEGKRRRALWDAAGGVRRLHACARTCTTGYLVARSVRLPVENLWTGRRIGGASIERLGEAILART